MSERLLRLCAAGPAIATAIFSAAVVVAAASGLPVPFWQGGPLTMSEAAALRDGAEVINLIARGQDPNAVYDLRANVLARSKSTPLEAAVAARRGEMVDLLMHHGARVDAQQWTALHCVALETGVDEVVAAVNRYRPAEANESCRDSARGE